MYEEGNPLKPMVIIEDSVFEGLCAPWQDALLVKLTAGFEVIDLGNDFLWSNLKSNEEDKTKVMEQCPWR